MSATSILLLLLVCLIGVWVVRRRRWQRMLWSHGIPGPEPNFLIGSINFMDNRTKAFDTWIPKYGKIFSVFANGPRVIVADPELVRLIQVKDFHIFPLREKLFPRGGFEANPRYEVSVAMGDLTPQRWKEQRALITTAFSSSKIKASVTLVNESIDVLMENIDARQQEADFDIYDLFQRLTMDTIGRSAFGYHSDVQRNPDDEFFQATKKVFNNLSQSWFSILAFVSILFPEFFSILYPIRIVLRNMLNWIGKPSHFTIQMKMCIRIVAQRKRMKQNGEPVPDDILQRMIDATLSTEEMKTVTQNHLTAGQDEDMQNQSSARIRGKVHRMNDEECAANASVMFDAGFETTSTLLAFLFHVLVNRQEIQDEVRKELNLLLEQEGEFNYNVLHSLPYLESVIYETMRIFTPVTGFVARTPITDYKYKNITIPAGVIVEIAVQYLHKDPQLWHEPETFDPLRFYGENKGRIQSPAFQAFGGGPRNCLGIRFAMMEAKLTVARLLSNYKVLPGLRTEAFDKLQVDNKPVTQNPKNGVFVRVVRV